MAAFDATESLTPFRDARAAGGGAILFDATCLRQAGVHAAEPVWFDPAWWGDRAEPVGSGGRGAAWFVEGTPSEGGCPRVPLVAATASRASYTAWQIPA